MKLMPVGVDIAKNVMQVHFVNTDTGEIYNKALKRDKFLEFFINRSPCLIGMEACGGRSSLGKTTHPSRSYGQTDAGRIRQGLQYPQ